MISEATDSTSGYRGGDETVNTSDSDQSRSPSLFRFQGRILHPERKPLNRIIRPSEELDSRVTRSIRRVRRAAEKSHYLFGKWEMVNLFSYGFGAISRLTKMDTKEYLDELLESYHNYPVLFGKLCGIRAVKDRLVKDGHNITEDDFQPWLRNHPGFRVWDFTQFANGFIARQIFQFCPYRLAVNLMALNIVGPEVNYNIQCGSKGQINLSVELLNYLQDAFDSPERLAVFTRALFLCEWHSEDADCFHKEVVGYMSDSEVEAYQQEFTRLSAPAENRPSSRPAAEQSFYQFYAEQTGLSGDQLSASILARIKRLNAHYHGCLSRDMLNTIVSDLYSENMVKNHDWIVGEKSTKRAFEALLFSVYCSAENNTEHAFNRLCHVLRENSLKYSVVLSDMLDVLLGQYNSPSSSNEWYHRWVGSKFNFINCIHSPTLGPILVRRKLLNPYEDGIGEPDLRNRIKNELSYLVATRGERYMEICEALEEASTINGKVALQLRDLNLSHSSSLSRMVLAKMQPNHSILVENLDEDDLVSLLKEKGFINDQLLSYVCNSGYLNIKSYLMVYLNKYINADSSSAADICQVFENCRIGNERAREDIHQMCRDIRVAVASEQT